jgi:hypothetical protein
METMSSFQVGSVYFIVWYHDQDYLYPSFDSVIFIGKNLRSADRKSSAWYFQDLDSYIEVAPTHVPGNEYNARFMYIDFIKSTLNLSLRVPDGSSMRWGSLLKFRNGDLG